MITHYFTPAIDYIRLLVIKHLFDYRLHSITQENVINYSWLRLLDYDDPMSDTYIYLIKFSIINTKLNAENFLSYNNKIMSL